MSDPIADALWEKVVEDFTSDKTHEAFLAQIQREHSFEDAARRYRAHRDSLPEDDEENRERADKRLGAIAIVAMASMESQKSVLEEPRPMRTIGIIAVIIAIGAVVGLIRALSV